MKKRRGLSPPLMLALSYLLFSVTWILFTDQLVEGRPEYARLQHVKGILFVILSSLLLYAVTFWFYRSLRMRFRENKILLARYELLQTASQEPIIDYDLSNDSATLNEPMMALLGSTEELVTGFRERFMAHVHPSDRQRMDDQWETFIRSGAKKWVSRFEFRAGGDGYRSMRAQGLLVRLSDKPVRMVFSLLDETDVMDARAKLLYQEVQSRAEQTRLVIAAEERERERWAQELHDNVCQMLTAAGLTLDLTDAPDVMQQKARGLVQRSLDEIRSLSASIRPPAFREETLEESLHALTANIQRFRSIEVSLHFDDELEAHLDEDRKLMLYRIVQEQLNNILKYAEAQSVAVHAGVSDGEVCLSVVDDGRGFDPAAVASGIGLRNIRNRLQSFSGRLVVDSAPGDGCRLEASFPLLR